MARKVRPRRKPPVSLSEAQLLALLALSKEHRPRDWVMILITYWHGLRASETLSLRERDFTNGMVKVTRGKGSDGGWQPLQEHENPLLNERAAIEDWLANRVAYGEKGGAKLGSRKQVIKRQQSSVFVAIPPNNHASLPLEIRVKAPVPDGAESPCDDRLFPLHRSHFWKIVHRYALAAGIPPRKCKTHMLKHTIAKHLIRSGLPVNEVQAWMGWKSLETANWYLMADEDELGDRVGKAIRGKDGFRRIQQGYLFESEPR